MAETPIPTLQEFLARLESAWTVLQSGLAALSGAQMTGLQDAQGWSVKDHIIHLAAWERSVVFFLQGRPRADGLGISDKLFHESVDEVNAAIQARNRDKSLAEAQAEFRNVHRQLLETLAAMTDADLRKGFEEFQPGESPGVDGRTAYEVIENNTAGHYEEHQPWIDALVRGG
jgi:hypothetical protein